MFFRNLSDVLDAGLTQYPYKYYTLQHYPTHTCSGPNAKNTNITYFVSHANGESQQPRSNLGAFESCSLQFRCLRNGKARGFKWDEVLTFQSL